MRFGAMFAASKDDKMPELRHYPKKKRLELFLRPGTDVLYGEVAEARLNALAAALDDTEVVVKS